MRTSLSVFLTVLLTLGLLGCRSFWDPTFMPAGYTYHDGNYNAPPGPEASDIGYDYSEGSNAEVLQVWRIVVKDLLEQLSKQIGATAKGIYIRPLSQTNAFNNSYDHVLREALGARGYVLSANPEGALHLWYEAHVPKYIVDSKENYAYKSEGEQGNLKYQNLPDYEEFVLIFTVVNEGDLVAKAAGVYKLPPYGFLKKAGVNDSRFEGMKEGAE